MESHDLKFAFTDFLRLVKYYKKTVLLVIFIGAIACALYAMTRPAVYIVQASFRDKGKTQASIRSSLTDLLFSQASSHDSEALSTMRSFSLLSKVIKELNSQGSVSRAEDSYPEIENAYANILAEWAYWAELRKPILDDLKNDLKLQNIQYDGEIIRIAVLDFIDNRHYQARSEKGEFLGKGELNIPFITQDMQFTVLENNTQKPIQANDRFVVLIQPMRDMVKLMSSFLVIDIDREDKTLLRLQFKHRDRHFAVQFLNTLMHTYQNYLESEHEQTSNLQLTYLEKRQKEVGAQLEKLMQNHLEKVSEDMSSTGFTSLQKEMEFLAANLAMNEQKLTELKLEKNRIGCIDVENCVHYDAYTGRGDPAIINHLLAEIRALKQQSDALELALQNHPAPSHEQAKAFLDSHFKTLENTQACLKECDDLIVQINQQPLDKISIKTLASSSYPINSWLVALKSKDKAWQYASSAQKGKNKEDLDQFKNHFLNYLDSFQRLLRIQEQTLVQNLRTLQDIDPEYEGLNLETSRNLYLTYIRELNELQASEKQHRFVIEQLKNPNFEISSLTAILHDPISHERISKTTQLLLQVKDEVNRTQKERERMQEDIDLQISFLTAHIQQIADLMLIKQNLLDEKIKKLQAVALSLTHQQMALLKKNLNDYIAKRIENLEQEERLLNSHQEQLHTRMAKMPPKWAEEQLLTQNLTLHQRFLENLSNMVESKNITKNLEMVQSSSLDKAIAPLNPKPPRLAFYTVFGAMLGFISVASFLFTKTMLRGMPASLENIKLANFHISGLITPYQGDEISATMPLIDSDLDTMRRLIAHFEEDSPLLTKAKLILLVKGSGPDFSNTLSKLLSKKGQRVLKMALHFNKEQKESGLLQYLEGKQDLPVIEKMDGFDRITAGGISRYSEELLRSPRFINLLEQLKSSYDWIIGVTAAHLTSAEAENLAKLFDGTVLVITDELLPDILTFSQTLEEEKKKNLTFVISK